MNKPQRREGFVDDDATKTETPAPIDTPAELEAPAAPTWPMKIRLLHKPIRNNKGETVNVLEFREPTGGDINRFGSPVRINWDGEALIDDRKMIGIMANLTGILQPFLEQLDPRDYQSCAYRLRDFFIPSMAGWE